MTDKAARPAFQPAPRPRPINDAGATEALRKATEDLGFNRTTSAPAGVIEADVASPAQATPAPAPKALAVAPAPRAAPKPKAVKPAPATDFSDRETSLKFVIDDELSTALKLDAVRRRVTVKFLVLEALAEKGYPVDMATLHEDGRRVRK
ncbi:hypothetical protein [Caulobacter sp. CCH5-E12]|jgi:pyruvate/2-oxoglutarate dehydrogenase complex dihydrolipoamide acyltransferase (E2) component|uniref:hypothetical protein n=1 Tax=Caulobacter sp. CCH5-E12 TaxID=1768770 RepID=UPI0007849165|nr:hypothetical protein [Caulobacter sp. CCH5-E12]MCA0359020.1 hypothetical protein [Pseudomonadota bacterium]